MTPFRKDIAEGELVAVCHHAQENRASAAYYYNFEMRLRGVPVRGLFMCADCKGKDNDTWRMQFIPCWGSIRIKCEAPGDREPKMFAIDWNEILDA